MELSARSSKRLGRNQSRRAAIFSREARRGGDFFEQDLFSGDLQGKFFEQEFGGDDGLQIALLRAGRERFVGGGVIQIHGIFPLIDAAKFTSAPGTDGGSRMPTIFWPAQTRRRRRARKIELSSALPQFMRGRRLSPMAKRKG